MFQVARRAGFAPEEMQLQHVPFGLVQGKKYQNKNRAHNIMHYIGTARIHQRMSFPKRIPESPFIPFHYRAVHKKTGFQVYGGLFWWTAVRNATLYPIWNWLSSYRPSHSNNSNSNSNTTVILCHPFHLHWNQQQKSLCEHWSNTVALSILRYW